MSEAIKVEVGQVWDTPCGRRGLTKIENGWYYATNERGGPACGTLEWLLSKGALLSPAPAKLEADRSGCKAWCGLLAREALKPSGSDRWHHFDDFGGKGQRWCTPACRDAKYPPMGETKQDAPVFICTRGTRGCTASVVGDGRVHSHNQTCKDQWRAKIGIDPNAEPSAKPGPAKAPKCTNDYVSCGVPLLRHLKDEAQLMCDDCYVALERAVTKYDKQTGTPYTGTERLAPKQLPPLAVDWVEDCL